MVSLLTVLVCAGSAVLGSAIPLEARAPVDQCRKVNLGIARQPAQQQALYAPFCSSYLSPFSATSTVGVTSTGISVVTVSSIDSKTVTTTTTSLTTSTVQPTPVTVVESSIATVTSLSLGTTTSIRIYKRASRTKLLPVATPTGLSGASPQQVSLTCACQGVYPKTVTALTTISATTQITSTSSVQSTTTATATASTAIAVVTTAAIEATTQTVSSTTTFTTFQATATATNSVRAYLKASASSGSVSNLYAYFASNCASTTNCIKFKSTTDLQYGRFRVLDEEVKILTVLSVSYEKFFDTAGGSVVSSGGSSSLVCRLPAESNNFLLDCSQSRILNNDGQGTSYSPAQLAVCGGELWVISASAPAVCPAGAFEYVTLNFIPIF